MWKDTLDLISNYYNKNEREKIIGYLCEVIDEYGQDYTVQTREVKNSGTYTMYDRPGTVCIDGVQITTTTLELDFETLVNTKSFSKRPSGVYKPSGISKIKFSKTQYLSSSKTYENAIGLTVLIHFKHSMPNQGDALEAAKNFSDWGLDYPTYYKIEDCSLEILRCICDLVSSSIECSFNNYAYEY